MKNGREKHILVLRFLSVRKEIRWAFGIALTSLMVIELILKNYPAFSDTLFRAGDLYLKLCYSIVASSIFFFINQHLPKEEKKLRLVHFLSWKLNALQNEVSFLLMSLDPALNSQQREVTDEMVNEACRVKNPRTPVLNMLEPHSPFQDWYSYLDYKVLKIRAIINELTTLHDSLDADLLETLLSFENHLYTIQLLGRNHGNEDLAFLSRSFNELKELSRIAREIERAKYGMLVHAAGERYKARKKKRKN